MERWERRLRARFHALGWFSELRNWIESVVEPIGLHVNGRFRQLNASPSFSLIRFETDGPALWFKAVGEPNQREFTITCPLAQLFPDYLPRMFWRLDPIGMVGSPANRKDGSLVTTRRAGLGKEWLPSWPNCRSIPATELPRLPALALAT